MSETLLERAIRDGETYVQMQLQLAIAADQRAISLGGILTAAASVVLGLMFSGSGGLEGTAKILWVVLAAGLGVGAALAFWSARPVLIKGVGNLPSSWEEDIKAGRPLVEALQEQASHLDRAATDNLVLLRKNGTLLRLSMFVSAGGVLVTAIGGAIIAIAC